MTLVQTEPKKIYIWNNELKAVYLGSTQVRPVIPYLCFTANVANSSVKLTKNWSPTAVTLETSTDGSNWSTYTIWNTITLSNIWDNVYWRNTSTTDTGFSTSAAAKYQFVMTGNISASWDINYLLNKNSTTTVPDFAFRELFTSCAALVSCPRLPATSIWVQSYNNMFNSCTGLKTLPKLPATTLKDYSYWGMFYGCSNIKISATQTWDYQTPYRIPTSWTWTVATDSLGFMFRLTWWTFDWTPTINTTYYTSNTLV